MTRSFSLLALGAIILFGADLARAQDAVAERVKVPFEFRAGQAVLPAGEYEVRFDDAAMPGLLRIRSEDGRQFAFVLVHAADMPKDPGDKPRLRFEKDGDVYVLTEVVDPGAYRALWVGPLHRTAPDHAHAEAAAE